MSSTEALSQWEETVSRHLPHLSKPQALVLALWSYAMVISQSCGTTSAAMWLAELLGGTYDAWRQRLREWCYDSREKKGAHRSEVAVVSCFAPLLRWIVTWWAPGEHRLALALDASTLSDRFTVLCMSVVYRGCALPVAWCIVSAGEPGAWKPDWIALLQCLDGVIPQEWTVIVLADRGLYARWLYQEIQALHWHPFLRINKGGKARLQGQDSYRLYGDLRSRSGLCLEWVGALFYRSVLTAGLHLSGPLGCRLSGSLAYCDRPLAISSGCGVVWHASVD